MAYNQFRRNLTFVRKVRKYVVEGTREILKTTTLYSDGKTQVPKKVIKLLKLTRGSQIVWVREGGKIYVESPTLWVQRASFS